MNRRLKIIIILVIFILMTVIIHSCISSDDVSLQSYDYSDVTKIMKEHWKIELNLSGELKYEKDNLGGLPMEGVLFAVVSADSIGKDAGIKWIGINKKVIEILSETMNTLDINEYKAQDYNSSMYCLNNLEEKRLLMIYDEGSDEILIVEETM